MLERAEALQDRLTGIRRRVHQHPELGFREVETACLIGEVLAELGIPAQTGVGKTGVVGRLGQGPPTVGLRADMDALPIQEENDVAYRSQVSGVMHACGHDAHVACLLGAAMLLAQNPPPGEVRFFFQPSEEGQDEEGKSGAMRLVEEGALEEVGAIFALHSYSDLDSGWIGVRSGPICAAVDTAYVTVLGRGAHGAYPERGLDPILLASQVITALHTIVSRRLRPIDPAVITVGTIHGGTASNIIPEDVTFSITIRSFDPEVRRTLQREIDRACGITRALGGDYRLRILEGYPPTVNDGAMAALVAEVGGELLGPDRVVAVDPTMGAEDFSYYLRQVPGCFFRLGTRVPGEEPRVGHNPRFDLDERALPIGAAMLAAAAGRYLAQRAV
jgi:IAA-amino acid hydrolase